MYFIIKKCILLFSIVLVNKRYFHSFIILKLHYFYLVDMFVTTECKHCCCLNYNNYLKISIHRWKAMKSLWSESSLSITGKKWLKVKRSIATVSALAIQLLVTTFVCYCLF